MKAAMEGELLAGVGGDDRVGNPESLEVGGQGGNPGRAAVIGHHDPLVFHELGKKRGLAPGRSTEVQHQMARGRRQGEGGQNRGKSLGMEETEGILDKRSRVRQACRLEDKVGMFHRCEREPPAFQTKANFRRRRLEGIQPEMGWEGGTEASAEGGKLRDNLPVSREARLRRLGWGLQPAESSLLPSSPSVCRCVFGSHSLCVSSIALTEQNPLEKASLQPPGPTPPMALPGAGGSVSEGSGCGGV